MFSNQNKRNFEILTKPFLTPICNTPGATLKILGEGVKTLGSAPILHRGELEKCPVW